MPIIVKPVIKGHYVKGDLFLAATFLGLLKPKYSAKYLCHLSEADIFACPFGGQFSRYLKTPIVYGIPDIMATSIAVQFACALL